MTGAESASARPPAADRREGPGPAGRSPADREVTIRPMRAGDVPAVVEVERRSFPVPWRETTFRRLLRREGTRAWTAADGDGAVAGYAVAWLGSRGMQLGNLAVAVGRRRRGLGRRLVRTVMRSARAAGAEHVFLEVRESNDAALGLYRSAGFRLLGRRTGYYRSPPEDAIVMGADPR